MYPEYRQIQRDSPTGVALDVSTTKAHDLSPEERQAEMERRWKLGGAPIFNVAFADTMTNIEANTILADFVRGKIRETVKDPAVAEELVPTDHPIAAKRLCCDSGYYETFNKEHVTLVNVRKNPIRRIRRNGIELQDGTVHEVDMIVYALGYDALSGALLNIDVRGRNGESLADAWADGPTSYLGIAVHGFPNMFTVTGPGSPSVLAVMSVAIEQHIEWIDECIAYMEQRGLTSIEADGVAQKEWTALVEEIIQGTVMPLAKNSYYTGANVPGKPNIIPLWAAGQKSYRDKAHEIAQRGYEGFILN